MLGISQWSIKNGYVVVKLLNPWKKRKILQTYYLMPRNAESENISDGVRVDVPIQRSVVFTSAHANLIGNATCRKVYIWCGRSKVYVDS